MRHVLPMDLMLKGSFKMVRSKKSTFFKTESSLSYFKPLFSGCNVNLFLHLLLKEFVYMVKIVVSLRFGIHDVCFGLGIYRVFVY